MTRKLILIKHAKPYSDPTKPSHEWTLSDQGREQARVLGDRVREYAPRVIVTSEEPKAAETGRIVAEILGAPCESAAGLEEHDRSNVPMMDTREFISTMAMFFKRPDELVLGRETAAQALARFDSALNGVLANHPAQDLAVVTHGTVLSLFVERAALIEPFSFWRRMGLPSFVVFRLPEMRMIETIERV
jgi:broad specificity phosphatase PhoE